MTGDTAGRVPLLEQNLRLFAERVSPELAARLATLESDAELLPAGPPAGPNIQIGGQTLYPEPADRFAARQVAQYLQNPQSLSLRPKPALEGAEPRLDDIAIEKLHRHARALGLSDRRDPDCLTGYLTVFGIGLGFHVSLLLERLNARTLVVADETPVFLALSVRLIDWRPIFELVSARGGRVICLFDGDPQRLANKVYTAMRGKDRTLLDGSYIFQHYRTPFLTRALDLFAAALPVIGDSDGFFEDECLMLQCFAGNMAGRTVELLTDGPDRDGGRAGRPAVVVGSGPSIDDSIDDIRRIRDRVTLISGGTALNVLLEAGLRPDYHCEIENVAGIYTVNANAAARHDLSGITLIASATIDPRIAGLFDRTVFILRDQLVPTHLFADPQDVLPMAGPTVTHLACRAAMALGAGEVYLFGVDLGAVSPEKHHSSRSIYGLSDDPYWRDGAQMERLVIPVPGNLRETVFTSREFIFARLYFSTLATENPAIAMYNCSDGARIEGAAPLKPGEADPPVQQDDGEARALKHYRLETPAFDGGLADTAAALAVLAERVERTLGAGGDYVAIQDAVANLIAGAGTARTAPMSRAEEAAHALLGGTISMVLLTAHGLWARIAGPARPDFCAVAADVLRETLTQVRLRFQEFEDAGR